MAYEKFERQSVRVSEPTLSVTPRGRVALNAAACRIMEQVKSVVILWDKTTCGIGIQAAQKGDKDSYAVTFSSDRHAATFAATAFLKHIGWFAKGRVNVPAIWDSKHRILEAKLPAEFVGGARGTPNRKGGR